MKEGCTAVYRRLLRTWLKVCLQSVAAIGLRLERGGHYPFLFAVLLSVAGWCIAVGFSWQWLVRFNLTVVVVLLRLLGHTVSVDQVVYLVDGKSFQMTDECIYIDIMLLLMPVVATTARRNALAVVVTFVVTCHLINWLRIVVAVKGYLNGGPWVLWHDSVDLVLWNGVALLIYTAALR